MGLLQYNQISPYLGPLALLLVAVGFLYTLGLCIYNLYFHPLARYPGPFLAKISPVGLPDALQTWTNGQIILTFTLDMGCMGPLPRPPPLCCPPNAPKIR